MPSNRGQRQRHPANLKPTHGTEYDAAATDALRCHPKKIRIMRDQTPAMSGRKLQLLAVGSSIQPRLRGSCRVDGAPLQCFGQCDIDILIQVEANRHQHPCVASLGILP